MKEYLDIQRIVEYVDTPSTVRNECTKVISYEEYWSAEIFEDDGGADDFEQGILG